MTGLPRRFPRPLTAGQLHAVPLRALARPAPIGRDVRVDPDLIIHHPRRVLARRWASSNSIPVVDVIGALLGDVDVPPIVLRCSRCGAPVRHATPIEVLYSVKYGGGWPSVDHDCLWHSHEAAARAAGEPVRRIH